MFEFGNAVADLDVDLSEDPTQLGASPQRLDSPTTPRERLDEEVPQPLPVRVLADRCLELIAVLALRGLMAFALLRDGGTTDEVDQTPPALDLATRAVQSGSPYDAPRAYPLNPATAAVPSGSPYDAPRASAINPATDRVPSGSPYDAPRASAINPATDRVPSGSPFDVSRVTLNPATAPRAVRITV